jgi:hypothetical protein
LVYVDIIVASSSSHAVEALLADLKSEFALKDLGELYFSLVLRSRKHLKANCSVKKSMHLIFSAVLGCYIAKM